MNWEGDKMLYCPTCFPEKYHEEKEGQIEFRDHEEKFLNPYGGYPYRKVKQFHQFLKGEWTEWKKI